MAPNAEYQPDLPEHDLLFRVFVRRHHVGRVGKQTAHNLLKRLRRHITVSSQGAWQVEVCEVASVTRTRGGKS